jgi:hypothetical protein
MMQKYWNLNNWESNNWVTKKFSIFSEHEIWNSNLGLKSSGTLLVLLGIAQKIMFNGKGFVIFRLKVWEILNFFSLEIQ